MGLPLVSLVRLVGRLPPVLTLTVLLFCGFNGAFLAYLVFRLVVRQVGIDLRYTNREKRRKWLESLGIDEAKEGSRREILGLFHPYCNAGGGGERVLWTAVAYHQREHPQVICAVYSGDIGVSKDEIVATVKKRFAIELDASTLLVIPLSRRRWVEDSSWPRFTLIGQSLGSVWLGWEAITTLIPDVYIDTMGYAFTLPLFKHLAKIPVGAYVHYPTISTDMLSRVSSRQSGVTNSDAVAGSWILSEAKFLYYVLFLEMYSLCLRQADDVMVNSSWTKNHVDRLLKSWLHRDDADDEATLATGGDSSDPDSSSAVRDEETTDDEFVQAAALRKRNRRSSSSSVASRSSRRSVTSRRRRSSATIRPATKPTFSPPPTFPRSTIVYPPCDTASFTSLPLMPRGRIIVSISQFRPEKAQDVQIRSLAILLNELCPAWREGKSRVELVLAGSVRNQGDEDRVEGLRTLARQLGVASNVRFEVNVEWTKLRALLGKAVVGMNTMVDEHFGISVVEFMAAGLVPLVHASGGPRHDIVVPLRGLRTGFYATDPDSYADVLQEVLEMDEEDLAELRSRARRLVQERFERESFEDGWQAAWDRLRAAGKAEGR